MKRTVLCVGNCGYDQTSLNSYLRSRFDVEVLAADRASDAESLLSRQAVDLVLVNRVFDRDGDSGIDWIRRRFGAVGSSAKAPPAESAASTKSVPPKAMLISGYDDAQREAVKAGALPGFGKNDLRGEVAAQRIAAALEAKSDSEQPSTSEMQGESETSDGYS